MRYLGLLLLAALLAMPSAAASAERAAGSGGPDIVRKISGRTYHWRLDGISPVRAECVMEASRKFRVPVSLILTIMDVEGGEVGCREGNTNGTWDLGPMQVNTCHLPEIRHLGIGEDDLIRNGCLNVHVGTFLLRKLMDRHKNVMEAVGRYHSGNQPHKARYQGRAAKAYRTLKSNPAKHIPRVLDKANRIFRERRDLASR